MATTYASLRSNIRAAVHDWGATNNAGTTSYQYENDAIDAALENVLLNLDSYSGDGTNITPTVSDDNVKGFLIYATAFELTADPERIHRWAESGAETISRDPEARFIFRLLATAQEFYGRKYGTGYAKYGALEAQYDSNDFSDYLEEITD